MLKLLANLYMNKMKGKIVLGVAAHPDDLDFGASGTIAKWIKDGATVYYLICTDGSKGSDDPKMTHDKLTKIRRQEQIAAGKILGLKNVYFLNHKDAEIMHHDINLKRDIVRYIRLLKPDIVMTIDPALMYSTSMNFINHSDHRAVGLAAMDAVFPLARDRLTFIEHEHEGMKPHKVKSVYFINFDSYTQVIDVTDSFETKLQALEKHKSQVNEKAIKRITEIAKLTGRKRGFAYGESFNVVNLP